MHIIYCNPFKTLLSNEIHMTSDCFMNELCDPYILCYKYKIMLKFRSTILCVK